MTLTDDTNISFSNKSPRKINEYINHDLSQIVQWHVRQKLFLSITKHFNFRISGQKTNIVKQTKYLGIFLDEHLTRNF